MGAFTGRSIGSLLAFAILSGFGIAWTFLLVLIPMLTTPFVLSLAYIVNLLFQLLICGLMLGWGILSGLDLINRTTTKKARFKEPATVSRISLNLRVQHVWLIVTVFILALTGFAQLNYESWGRLIVLPLGGLQVSMNLHYLAAFFLGILAVYHFAFHGTEFVVKRAMGKQARLAIMQGKSDLVDMYRDIKYKLGRGEEPKFGKYSYVQKYDYWGIYWGILVLGVPGLLLWAYGQSFWGGLPYIFHTDEALLAVLWIGVIHLYHTHFNPREFPANRVFLTGKVPVGYMAQEHPLELQRIRSGGEEH
jgi:cytochrome b subunit of formate dehydrogenase